MTKFLKIFVLLLTVAYTGQMFGQGGQTFSCSVSSNTAGNDQAMTVWNADLTPCTNAPAGCVAPAFTQELTGVTISGVAIHYFSATGGTTFCPSWYGIDILVNGVQVADNQCAAAIMAYNYNQHAPITSIAFRAQNNDNFSDNMFFEFTVNKTYTCVAAADAGAVECLLVCSGDQNVTLAGGECTYTVPNLVTMAGPCLDGAVVPPPVVGFTGAFAYANRYFHNTALGSDPAYGNLPCTTTTGLPGTLVLQSADVLSGGNSCNYYGTVVSWTVPANGTISFNWATSTNDPGWDDFGYSTTLNPNTATGLFFANLQANTTVLADVTSSGMRSVPVTQGQIFSFINYTEDGTSGPLTATITNFRFQAAVVPAPWVINQVSGPAAGTALAPGTYTMCYELLNPAGDATDDCCFDIVVAGVANPSKTLVCNDLVNVSVDEDGWSLVYTDMILEGGPYYCYDNYLLRREPAVTGTPPTVALTLPLPTNPSYPGYTYGAVWVNCEDVGKKIKVEVLDPITGNRSWGYVYVEDKIAPVIDCKCQDIDIPTPVTSFAGSLDATDPVFDRCGFTGYGTWYYDVYQFTVTVSGSYTFTASSPAGDTYAYINSGSFDPANPCVGMIAQNDDSAGGLDPLITINLTAGTTYYYIFTTWSPFAGATGAYSVAISGPGQAITIVNPSDAPECQFSCYELDVVKGETVGMLYNIPGQDANKSELTTPPTPSDNCGIVGISFEDRITKTNCGDTKLVRDWKYTDGYGNVSLCSQTFTFGQITVFDLVPPVREVHLSCGLDASPAAIAGYLDVDTRPQPASTTNIGAFADDYAQTPYVVEWNEGYQYGYFTYTLPGYTPANTFHSQKVDNSVCNIYTTYTDDVIPACGIGCSGNMKVIRNWKLLDWCTGEVFTYTQVIKATDEKAPSFNVKNATISVDPWGCKANWTVEKPWELEDNCAKSEEIKWGVKVPAGLTLSGTQPNYSVTGMPKGTHAIVYWAEDCCGNITEKTAYVTVIDGSAPVAVAKQNIVMSLTGSGNGADGAGKIYGWQIDNGSYDHCSDVRFEVRRVDGGSCGNVGANGTHNNNSTYNNHNGYPSEVPGAVWFHPMDNAQDTDGGEFVKFCCEDIPAGADHGLHDVELRVWDDGNMNGIYGDNDIIYNGVTEMKDNYNTTWVTIRVENKLPPTLICPKDVTVTCDMELNLSEGVDTKVSDVNLTMTGYPKAYDLCSNLDITYSDQWVGQHDPVCKSGTIRRTFKVTKGSIVVTCTQFITVTTITVPFTVTFPNQNGTTEWTKCNFTLDDARDAANASIKRPIVNYGQCDIVGENITIDTFLFEDGACKKWRVKYSYKNWCTGEEINTIAGLPIVHWYAFKDVTAPVLSCSNQMFAANPNPLNPNGGCEASVALEASASDALICAEESWIKWQMFFDGWNNGTVDRLGSSFVNKSWNGIWVPQAKYIAGVLNPTWVALQNQHPNLPLADLVYVTYIKPTKASGETVKLPVGTGATAFILNAENINHKVLWKVTDGCGNVDQCESTVMVVDKKAPTPYCVSVSTALMQTSPKMVELWARDFDKGAFDNCSPQSKLYFTFEGAAPIYSRVNEEHFYKVVGGVSVNATAAEYAQGKAYKWLPSSRSAGFVWTAAGDYNVNVSVWDEAWNTDYCTVLLHVRGDVPGSRIAGNVATNDGQGVNNVTVTFTTLAPEYPKSELTGVSGAYAMIDNPNTLNYELKASKGGDYLNGVSTLDLVMIQRHILGLQALDNNYKWIAADANNDGKVTASDLTDLRKLILGVTNVLPNNASWRFPVAGTAVTTSPITFTEEINIDNLSADMNGQNFVAVKIGDVNGNVTTNINTPNVEGRSSQQVEMSVAAAAVAAGEVVEIPVTASRFASVSGFQYTMNLKGASFVGINGGAIEMNASNVGVLSGDVLTMSYANDEAVSANEGDVLFTLVVKADQATNVSEILSLTSDVTRAESYNGDLKVGGVSLSVRTAPVASIELFQNEPNPFKGQTTIMFTMPEAATATLSVHDVTGKVVAVRNISAMRGQNSEVFTKDQLGVSGVLYYTLKSGDFTATKKMIIVE